MKTDARTTKLVEELELKPVLEVLIPKLVDELPPGSHLSLLSFRDREVPAWEELVILVTVRMSAGEAMEFWDRLAAVGDEVALSLGERERKLLDEKVAIHVDWE